MEVSSTTAQRLEPSHALRSEQYQPQKHLRQKMRRFERKKKQKLSYYNTASFKARRPQSIAQRPPQDPPPLPPPPSPPPNPPLPPPYCCPGQAESSCPSSSDVGPQRRRRAAGQKKATLHTRPRVRGTTAKTITAASKEERAMVARRDSLIVTK